MFRINALLFFAFTLLVFTSNAQEKKTTPDHAKEGYVKETVIYYKFIRTKSFMKHFLLASVCALVTLWLAFKLFSVYTHHGVTFPVPDFGGQSVTQLNEFVKDKKVRYQIIDSIYDAKQTPGTI